METILLVDAANILFRSYFAIAPMSNGRGQSTQGLFGFIRSVQKLQSLFPAKYLVAIFDGPDNKKSRQELYQDYKGHRTAIPEDLPFQLEEAKRFCSLAGIPTLCCSGVEADDVIGTLATYASQQNPPLRTFICSSDKDLCQLVNQHTSVVHPHKDYAILNQEAVYHTFGVFPNQIVDYLALIGDSSDNIPGVKGIGPKTACALLGEFGTLDKILQEAASIPGKKGSLLIEGKEDALLSQKLATLDLQIEIPKALSSYAISAPHTEQLCTFYKEHHFLSLLKEISVPPAITQEYLFVKNENELEDLLVLLQRQNQLSIEILATNTIPMEASLQGISICISSGKAWHISLLSSIPLSAIHHFLSDLFKANILFFMQESKFVYHVLSNMGLPLPKIGFDLLLASYLLTPHLTKHSLETLCLEYFSATLTPLEKTPSEDTLAHYCSERADYILRLYLPLSEDLKRKNLLSLFETIEIPLVSVLFSMEQRGIFFDICFMQNLAKDLLQKLHSLEDKIHELAGESFNINSPKQLAQILFEKLQLLPPKKTQTGFSTAADTLEILQDKHPIIPHLQEYRRLEKLRSTYAEALPLAVNKKTHRIHCTFNQSVTATGRLSCQSPNLQNIPIRTIEGKKIREAFRPEKENWSLVSADYSQIELRLLAHFSEDPALLQAFKEGEDIHAYTASLLFSVPLHEVSPAMRHKAKAVNFGIVYGQQAFGLSQELSISRKEADEFISTYFQRYSRVKEYIDSCKEYARANLTTTTLLGRQRPIPDILSKNQTLRAAAERLAINAPLQGTAADLIKLVMIHIQEQWHFKSSFMLLQIHDELLFEVQDEEIPALTTFVKEKMENILQLRVPLVANISIGKNWGAC